MTDYPISHQYEYQVSAPNTALAIYQHESSASNLLNASPIRFTLQEATVPAPTPLQQTGTVTVEEDEVDTAPKEERRPGKSGAAEMLSSHKYASPKRGSASSEAEKPATTKDTAAKQPAAHAPAPAPAMTQTVREFQVTADMSTFNHQAYIERQVHYGGFNVDLKTLVAEDLAASVPLLGLADILTRKVEVPARIQSKRAQELAQRKTLREMWEEGMQGVRGSREVE